MINYYELEDEEIDIVANVASGVLSKHGIAVGDVNIDITMLTMLEMRELNAISRGIDKATDVLSFPTVDIKFPFKRKDYRADINPETGAVLLGEMMICREIMAEQAVEYGHSEIRELAYLAVHGMHHLLGYDHMEDGEKAVMRESEEAVLNSLNYKRY